ncbi:MAG TPA: universal stress protein [Pseudomonadales bacterium]|nr:universal stress protein [Pseudomonadales bacterium]
MYNSILVPHDGSDHAALAVELATTLLTGSAPKLHLLNVPEVAPGTTELRYWKGMLVDGEPSEIERRAIELLNAAEQSITRTDLDVRKDVFWIPPAQAILRQAKELAVDAIVMGSRGRSDLAGLVLGSVSHRVLHTAPCRVILIR